MKNDKCVIYIGYEIPDGDASSIRIFSNALALKEYGFEVYVLSFDIKQNNKYFEISQRSSIDGVYVYRAKMPNYKSLDGIKYLFGADVIIQAINKIKENKEIGVIIAYNHPSFSYDRLIRYAKKNKIIMVSDCTEWHTSIHYKGIVKAIKDLEIYKGMNNSYKKSDGIICISNAMRNHFKENKTVLIPPLQYRKNIDKFKKDNQEIRKFIYAGIPGIDKDRLDLIVGTFSKIDKPYRLDILGVTIDEFFDIFNINKKEKESIVNNKKIVFHGKVKHEEVINRLKKSDFSIIIRDASRKNNFGFPTKLAESVSCGIPVIVNNFSDVKYYTEKYDLGYCINSNKDLKKTLIMIIEKDSKDIDIIKEKCRKSNSFYYLTYRDVLGDFLMEL